MIVACVTRHVYPGAQEVRLTRLISTLHDAGDVCHVFCPAGPEQSATDAYPWGTVRRLVAPIKGFIGRVLWAPTPINPLWFLWLWRGLRRLRVDVVIVRDLRLAVPAFLAARLVGAAKVLDIGEHYPGMVAVLGKQTLAHHVTRNERLIALLERWTVRMADLVWVVAEENKKRLGLHAANIEVVNNYPLTVPQDSSLRAVPLEYSETGHPITMVSLGLIDDIRGLDLALRAFAEVLKRLPNTRFVIYGDGPAAPALKELTRALSLEGAVTFGGWVEPAQAPRLLSEAQIGVILHRICDLTEHTIPNKLFDYMTVGLPILATRLAPVARVLAAEECGISVEETRDAIAAGMESLVVDAERRRCYGNNGFAAIRARYKWTDEALKIREGLAEITPAHAARSTRN